MKGTLRLVVVLFVVCGIAAGALSFVNAATKERIAADAKRQRVEAMRKVLPDAQEFVETTPGKVWEARRGSELIGHVLAASTQGYGGPIESLVGVEPSGVVAGVQIVIQTETPGLGAKIASPGFLAQFQGRKPGELELKKDDPAGKIDAVTAATISSRALTDAVRKAVDAFEKGGRQ
jgi:electron transport complex protein RnfG